MGKVVAKLSGKRVLVTGGAGFVGSHLVEALIEAGALVYALDIIKPVDGYFSVRQLDTHCQFIYMDVNDASGIMDVISKYQIEMIFHLAAQPIVEVAYENPAQTIQSNIMGTVNVLESARRLPHVQSVILASSDKAYGKLAGNEYSEDHPLKGDHPYDVSKSAADLIAQAYYTTYDVPVVVTRFGNIYGEGDPNYTRLIPSIVNAIVKGEELMLRSDGSHTREFLYVKDVVDGYMGLAENIDSTKGQSFNFAANDVYTVLEVIRLVEEVVGQKIPHTILNTAKNEIPFQKLNSTKVKQAIGWSAKHTITSTFLPIINYYKAIR